ncbi:Retrovirus-related Pol polyprotein from transposon TNT 1-94 [Gossypium australe]|uniref:Retrovirus-related Pol polyprotein from transposon TNT 1-94 n=1 Tax=Gossypium australe TaxID=47621 RepID=A0A5B6WL90_9ROSI|nr:Retrovirus-related Pol polyprotein from transposon TNT 1-94 [Gossypium australe]
MLFLKLSFYLDYSIEAKSEVRTHIQNFFTLIETQFSSKIKVFRTDNGREFDIPAFYASKGIIQQTSCVGTPQQNVLVERKHQYILNVSWALLFHSSLPKHFLGHVVLHFVFRINRTPTPLLANLTPFYKLYQAKPDFQHLRVFGCPSFTTTLTAHRHKFDPRACECIFLGFQPNPQVTPTSQPNVTPTSPFQSSKPVRTWKPPSYLDHYHCFLSKAATNHLRCPTPFSKLSSAHLHFTLAISASSVPKTYLQASKHSNWREVMQTEMFALEQNNTWIIMDLPPGKTAIGCKWVSRVKHRANGSIERYKARLVAKGFTQIEAKITTVRLLLAIAASKNWYLHQLDINNAFLHGDLSEEVYMLLPSGFNSSTPNMVCKLQKSLYGLKQASLQWFSKLTSAVTSLDYIQSSSDFSLFIKKDVVSFTALLVYVDDVILAGDNLDEIARVKAFLDSTFTIKDLGDLKYFLGLEVARSSAGIHLCQRKYALDILSDFGFLDCKPVKTPMATTIPRDASVKLLPDNTLFRKLIGRLLYLVFTRLDIAFAIQRLSQFLDQPTVTHLQAAHHVLRYLNGCPASGLFFSASSSPVLKAFSDSDWAGCLVTRRSVTGYYLFYGDSLISWKAKKQTTVSRSSSKAEYQALASTACEIQWLRSLLRDLHLPISGPTALSCDNNSTLQLAANIS